MTARKRKPTTKALDKDSSRARPSPKRVKATVETPKRPVDTPKKRAVAPRAAKVDRNDPIWLTTNEKSPLAYEDLYTELSDPKTYQGLTKEQWEDLRESLPPNVPLTSNGYSIPMDFFKYDADFRRGIREFQEDLSTGRLDPEWQEAAAEAMEERARGDFDAHKENQFEEFWGQKQKLDSRAVAGESAKLKLETMIQNGVFKQGDYFSYSRVAGRAKSRVLVEKECRLIAVGSDTLTLAIPPGQLKYARPSVESTAVAITDPETEDTTKMAAPDASSDGKETLDECTRKSNEHKTGMPLPDPMADRQGGPKECEGIDANHANGIEMAVAETEEHVAEERKNNEPNWEVTSVHDLNRDKEPERKPEACEPQMRDEDISAATSHDSILHEISNLRELEIKILEIDGRLNLNEIRPSINPWKALRGKRNNQDLGTLFEMREEFYVWKHPHIPKPPRNGAYELR